MTIDMTKDTKSIEIPAGIGAILTDARGNVVAHDFDFARDGYGGFKLWEAQRIRAKRAAKWKYIRAYSYGDLAEVFDDYHAEEMVNKLIQKGKLRLTCIAVGYNDDLTVDDVNR